MDHCEPMPLKALANVISLAADPDPEKLFGSDPAYVDLMRRIRKTRRYYGGIAIAGERSYRVIVSQQDHPACDHRLEVYADQSLREKLNVKTNDAVSVDIYNKDDWLNMGDQGAVPAKPA